MSEVTFEYQENWCFCQSDNYYQNAIHHFVSDTKPKWDYKYLKYNCLLCAQGTREAISRHAADFGENLGKQNEVALIIDGKTLTYAMGCDLKKDFLDLCISCKVVVCCRVSPIQKAEVSDWVNVWMYVYVYVYIRMRIRIFT